MADVDHTGAFLAVIAVAFLAFMGFIVWQMAQPSKGSVIDFERRDAGFTITERPFKG